MSKHARRRSNEDVIKENESPEPADPSAPSDEAESTRLSERRRYWIIRYLSKSQNGSVTVDELRGVPAFHQAYGGVKDATLEQDFREIEKLIGGYRVFSRPDPRTLKRESLPRTEMDPQSKAKRQIGNLVVKLLGAEDEILYLSTGTTVEQTARALLDSKNSSVRVVLTDNFKVLDAFREKARSDPGRVAKIRLILLGGDAPLTEDDIAYDVAGEQQLARWHCTTAVVSAKGISPLDGCIYSYRQPDLKEKMLSDAKRPVPKIIIPVVGDKISPRAVAQVIFDPSKKLDRGPSGTPIYHIVTTKLSDQDKAALYGHGYKVHEASEDDDLAKD